MRCSTTFFGTAFSTTQAALLTTGASMLYVGDLAYGVHRFRKPLRSMLGPILSAGGQLRIALSSNYPLV